MADTPTRPPGTNPDAETPGTPYGPQPNGVDEAAGGADSSPLENEPSGVQRDAAEAARRKGQTPQSDPTNKPDDRSPCQAPPGWW